MMQVRPLFNHGSTDAEVQANVEDRTRAGGSVLLDWKLGQSSTIKSSNFIGYLDRDIYDRTKNYNLGSNYINIRGYNEDISQLLFSNAMEGKHFVLGFGPRLGCLPFTIHKRETIRNQG